MTPRIIYEPRGRALEYAPLAVSLYRGCSHGCTYCFAPDSTRTKREDFRDYPRARPNAIKLLKADAAELAGDKREILMSFTTDPYQPIEQQYRLTSVAIRILIREGLHFTILTKAGIPSLFDLERLKEAPDLFRYGTTLTLCNPAAEKKWEPYAASWTDRLRALKVMHDHGIPTWVSCEPLIDPAQTRYLIAQTLADNSVDEYRLGALNHVERTIPDAEIVEFVKSTEYVLRSHCKKFIFKKDLQPYLRAAGVHQ